MLEGVLEGRLEVNDLSDCSVEIELAREGGKVRAGMVLHVPLILAITQDYFKPLICSNESIVYLLITHFTVELLVVPSYAHSITSYMTRKRLYNILAEFMLTNNNNILIFICFQMALIRCWCTAVKLLFLQLTHIILPSHNSSMS